MWNVRRCIEDCCQARNSACNFWLINQQIGVQLGPSKHLVADNLRCSGVRRGMWTDPVFCISLLAHAGAQTAFGHPAEDDTTPGLELSAF